MPRTPQTCQNAEGHDRGRRAPAALDEGMPDVKTERRSDGKNNAECEAVASRADRAVGQEALDGGRQATDWPAEPDRAGDTFGQGKEVVDDVGLM